MTPRCFVDKKVTEIGENGVLQRKQTSYRLSISNVSGVHMVKKVADQGVYIVVVDPEIF